MCLGTSNNVFLSIREVSIIVGDVCTLDCNLLLRGWDGNVIGHHKASSRQSINV